jgi:fused signal recognition particle receptor
MFDSLKKRLRNSVEKISKKIEKEKLGKIRERITTRQISEKDMDRFFSEIELDLLQANVALEVLDKLKADLKETMINKDVKRTKVKEFITKTFRESLFQIVNQDCINLEKNIEDAKSKGKVLCWVFLGYNGSGKTTTIAKLAYLLQKKGYKIVFAAADTFRAASIEQLEVHGNKLGINIIKHQYGADPAAVVWDAIQYANNKKIDVVMADTAGRLHVDKNLMDELKKITRVNKPDLKILVLDSLTGNDCVEQSKRFDEGVGVDAVILTRLDINTKGGSILSVCHTIKKPIIFLGTGQEYKDLQKFKPKEFVKELFG